MKKLFLALILILFVSGCTGLPDFGFPNPFAPTGPETKELPPDIISIQNINVIPQTSIKPGDQFSVSFEIRNQEENLPVNNVSYDLFDTGLCTLVPGTGSPDNETITSLSPQETRIVDWTFQAPSADQIAYLSTTCPIRFKVNYNYNAVSQIDVVVISQEKYWELQRSGNPPSFTPTLSVGRGPIKIYFDFGTSLPVRNNAVLPVYLIVEDKGTGALSTIKNQTFAITIPSTFSFSGDKCTTYFSCSDTSRQCINQQEIPLIKKKSLQIKCSLLTENIQYEEKTYFMNASISYNYDVFGDAKVEVKP